MTVQNQKCWQNVTMQINVNTTANGIEYECECIWQFVFGFQFGKHLRGPK